MTMKGQGTAADPKGAVIWYRHAAAGGSSPATNNLGQCYLRGNGAPANPARAFYLFREAGKLGNPDAMLSAGAMLFNGEGVAKDIPEGAAWVALAAEFGDETAKRQVPQIQSRLTPEQAAQAQARVQALRATIRK
jgi:TPR repeat protein